MDERLHNILDGNIPEKGSEGLFGLPENHREFREHRKLQDAMRQNADVGALTSAEKAVMGGALAAAIGLDPSGSGSAVTPQTTGGSSAATGWWSARGIGTIVLAMALGAGLFAVFDRHPEAITKTVGIPVESTVPAAVPMGLPGPAPADCNAMVQQLRDSILTLQDKASSKSRRTGKKRLEFGKPVAGDSPEKYNNHNK